MKNRTLIGVVCIFLAVAMVFVVSPLINRVSEQKTEVVRVKVDIPKGEKVKLDDLEVVKISNDAIPERALTDAGFANSGIYYAAVDMKKGDFVTVPKLTDNANDIGGIMESLDGSHVIMSVPIASFAAGISGKLENGDIVSLVVTQKGVTNIPMAFKYVRLLTTTTSGGVDKDKVIKNDDGTFPMPSTATFLLTPRQAALLKSYGGAVHIILVYRGEEEKAQEYLQVEQEYLDSLELAAREAAKKMIADKRITTDDKAFNDYYEAHRDEFMKMMDDIFEKVFGMNFETLEDDSSIYDDVSKQPEEPTSQVEVPSVTPEDESTSQGG